MGSTGEVTALLRAWHAGEPGALNALTSLIYPVLRGLAAAQMLKERGDHTLEPTALVNEAFLRLVKAQQVDWQDRGHFLAISSRLMRQVLVDYARSRSYEKRGGRLNRTQIDDSEQAALTASPMDLEAVLAVHMAVEALELHDPRKAQVVEMRFFGGLTVEQTAAVLAISEESVNRDWRLAKAWLLKHITETGGERD